MSQTQLTDSGTTSKTIFFFFFCFVWLEEAIGLLYKEVYRFQLPLGLSLNHLFEIHPRTDHILHMIKNDALPKLAECIPHCGV